VLSSVLWDKNVTKRKKNVFINNTVEKYITTYAHEVWQIKEKIKK
jgi:hypothetical protein